MKPDFDYLTKMAIMVGALKNIDESEPLVTTVSPIKEVHH